MTCRSIIRRWRYRRLYRKLFMGYACRLDSALAVLEQSDISFRILTGINREDAVELPGIKYYIFTVKESRCELQDKQSGLKKKVLKRFRFWYWFRSQS